ncbi:carboxymuconolactone decarboxylase family protein [Methyloglobulus sp.]|uniref:carboxymuconolactone decarboxylase family protein n=1 Tax=Methyloglobulus sp. TaxID=2518622 RepID=UPI0039890103
MSYLPSSPDLANIIGLFAKYPRRGILLFKLLEDIKGSFSPLSKGMRELIITYITALNESETCYNAHKSLSKELGIDESYSQSISDIDSANVEEKLKPILHFVKKLTLTPEQITQADVKPIFEAGWDERAFLDSVCICAVVNCMNRFAMGIGIDQEAPPNKQTLPFNSDHHYIRLSL